jgi:maltose alpha-D-glucosyltransferase/alpha-amylase
LFARVGNQGDAWTYTLNHLERFAAGALAPNGEGDPHALFTAQMHTLGRRIGEMHVALSMSTTDESFAPEPVKSADLSRWYSAAHFDAEQLLLGLQQALPTLTAADRDLAQALVAKPERLLARIRQLCSDPVDALKIRRHGNLHLGKVLIVANDLLITGFEGDASLPLAERRRKDSPLHDVATLLRSFDYARATAQDRALAGRPDLRERLEPALGEWLRVTREAFLAGYRRGLGDARPQHGSDANVRRLIELFEIAQALREARHELATRPAGVGAPLAALSLMLEM